MNYTRLHTGMRRLSPKRVILLTRNLILLTQESYANGCFSLEIFCIEQFKRDEIPIRLHDRGCKIIYREMRHFFSDFISKRFLLKFLFLVLFVIHCAQVAHICVSNTKIIGSDNGLLPVRRLPIIWSNAGISMIGHLGISFSKTLIVICAFSSQ